MCYALFVGKRKKRQLWHKSPYDGVPGIGAAIKRFLYQIEGPSQLGSKNEPAYVPPADPKCPICNQSVKDHRFDRSEGRSTAVRCPKPQAEQKVGSE